MTYFRDEDSYRHSNANMGFDWSWLKAAKTYSSTFLGGDVLMGCPSCFVDRPVNKKPRREVVAVLKLHSPSLSSLLYDLLCVIYLIVTGDDHWRLTVNSFILKY